jgi:glycyl-tRNA synthetase beta chain
MTTQNLLVELLVEELPPKALNKLGIAFAQGLLESLHAQGLVAASTPMQHFASPRRLAVHLENVLAQAPDRVVSQKLMPVSVGLKDGQPTPALLKKCQALGLDAAVVADLQVQHDGKVDVLWLQTTQPGVALPQGLQKALLDALAKLPIPKVMTYQLESGCPLPGWSSVSFVRPAHGLVALHGAEVVPVSVLGLQAGRTTQGHRFEARVPSVHLAHADDYAQMLERDGAVLASFSARRAEIVRQLQAAAQQVGQGVRPIEDEALLDEVTALVERPNVVICSFEREFLAVPQECLILTMKANQKYFPLLDAAGKLTHQFLVVSNIQPADTCAVVGGNERVVRPRLADAQFFFHQDRKKSLAERLPGLAKVVYHNKLGSQGDRMERVRQIAASIAQQLPEPAGMVQPWLDSVDLAARLAKADLLTDMVGEFPELQGIMGAYYARHDGLADEVAWAIEDHYKPRFAGDVLPRQAVGQVVALADKLETLVGLFGIGQLPTGDKDPFALRRHALGVIRIVVESGLPLNMPLLLEAAVPAFGSLIQDPRSALLDFMFERFANLLREQGYPSAEVDAVLALRPSMWAEVPKRLAAVRAFAALPESPALAAANKRISNILKKTDEVDAHVSTVLLQESAELALHAAMQAVLPQAQQKWLQGDYTASLQQLASLREPVDAFFDGVMVNAEALDVRLNRLGLLKSLHVAMNQVADLSKLAA